jgi:hypothetical protein
MGQLLGHGVRFGVSKDVMAAGKGIETMLSLRSALPRLPLVAALSTNHLAATCRAGAAVSGAYERPISVPSTPAG